MEVTLVTHNDLDGTVPVILAKSIWPELNYHQCSYNDVDEVVNKILYKDQSSLIHIVDIAINEETAHKLDKRGNSRLFDHHKTSLWLTEYDWAFVDTSKAASMIYFNYLNNKFSNNLIKFTDLISIVNDYDLWIHEFKESKQINRLLSVLGHTNFINRFLLDSSIVLKEIESYVLDLENLKIDEYINMVLNHLRIVNNSYSTYGICFADRYHSELGNKIIELASIEYVYIIDLLNSKVSIRGNGATDVSTLAKRHGGGGHHNAAGFILKKNDIDNFIEKIIKED